MPSTRRVSTPPAAAAGVTDHGALTGLTDDDHPQYVLETLLDARGDLIAASAADTPARVAAGVNGSVLVADSGQAAGLRWGSPSPYDILTAGQGLAAQNFERMTVLNGSALSSGQNQYLLIGIPKNTLVTNIHVVISTLGAGITAAKVGLYSKALARLAVSADLGTAWHTTGVKTHALGTPYTTGAADDVYYVGILQTFSTTSAQFGRSYSNALFSGAIGANPKLAFFQSSQTDLPDPAVDGGAGAFGIWVGVS